MTETFPNDGPTAQAIVLTGTLTDGFRFIGPFRSPAEAHAYIDREGITGTVAELEPGDGRIALALAACHVLIHGTGDEQPGTPACMKRAEEFARLAVDM